jgi:hypothetical protein
MNNFKVNFIISGTQKGGTTSANRNLNIHPDVHLAPDECHFFNDNFEQGLERYKELLKIPKKFKGIVGEKSPRYCMDNTALKRIKKTFPNIKIIFFIREPVSRLVSQFNMLIQLKRTQCKNIIEFSQQNDIDLNLQTPLERGYYIEQIDKMISLFGRENVFISISERCKQNPYVEYNKIFTFLEVRELKKDEFPIKKNVHKREYIISVSEKEKEYLHELYKPYNEKLYDFLGYEIDEWE